MDDYTFFMVMFSICVLVGLVTVVYVARRALDRGAGEIGGWELRGAWGRIFAVARITLAEGLRTKLAAGFAAIILLSLPIIWLIGEGDGTIKGQVQMFLAYSVGFASFMLALLTIFFSCRSLSAEIAAKQIFGVVSKPIPRWQILIGKWSGVMFLNCILVAITCIAIYVGTFATLAGFKRHLTHELTTHGGITPSQAAAAVAALDEVKGVGAKGYDSPILPVMAEALGMTDVAVGDMLLKLPEKTRVDLRRYDELRRQVLIARATVTPEMPDVTDKVKEAYAKMEADGALPAGWTPRQTRELLEAGISRSYRTVSFGQGRTWRLAGPKPDKGTDFLMSLRFKITPSQYMNSMPELRLEEETMQVAWGLGNPGREAPRYYEAISSHPVNTFDEFEIPADSVAADGTVIVSFGNIDPRRVDVVFDLPWGLQVLYRVGSFKLNVLQTGLAMLIPLACLAAFGVCASTFLSFQVGALIVITLYLMSASITFVADALGTTQAFIDPGNITWQIQLRQGIVTGMEYALAIGDCDPVLNLIEGRNIGWAALWTNTWKFVLLKGFAILALAIMIFRRRELGAVTV